VKTYAYFPGCSAEATAVALDLSLRAVAKVLEIELKEIEDWSCCGSSPYSSVDELAALCAATRNLALAEKMGMEMVTPCSSCYTTLNNAKETLKKNPQIKSQIAEALKIAQLEYHDNLRVRHIAEVFYHDTTYETIESKVKRRLKGLKVAPYYGCQMVRPGFGFDNPEIPQSLDLLLESLGADVVNFPYKASCCGGSLIISEEDMALGLIGKLLKNAQENGAQCLVTYCPLCQINLDVYQRKVEHKLKATFDLPILFTTQLMGLALQLEPKSLGLDKNIISPNKIIASYWG